jgi:outer membrane protein assembly factor BamB
MNDMRALFQLGFIGLLAVSLNSTFATDWPHWLGPDRNNQVSGEGFEPDLNQWKTAWKTEVGHGYASVIVAGGRAFTLGHDGKAGETVYCFDARTGEPRWKFSYPAELMPRMHPGGPNASPSALGNRVITVGKDGQMFCLSADRGEKLWAANLAEVLSVSVPQWGFGGSPVIHRGRILASAGKVAALDLESGKPVWVSKEAYHPGYTTPVVFEHGGREFVAALGGRELIVFVFEDGSEVARHPFKAQFDVTGSTPFILAQGNRIFLSGNSSSELLSFDGKEIKSVWTSTDLKNALNNSVIVDGIAYGIDGRQQTPSARLVALNIEDGTVRWAKENFGYGTTIGVGDTILALTENGELVSIKQSPASYQEQSRLQVLGRTCWTTPTYAGGRIYLRNDRGEVVCLEPGS